MKKFVFVLLALLSFNAAAIDWVCSTKGVRTLADSGADSDFSLASVEQKPYRKIDRLDLYQAYRGKILILGRTWLMVYMLPVGAPETISAFKELNVSPKAAEKMATNKDGSVVDRGLRVVSSQEELMYKLPKSHPAAGYVNYFSGGTDVALCF